MAGLTPRPDPTAHDEAVRARQLARARVMALLLGGFVLLVFFITIAKLRHGHH